MINFFFEFIISVLNGFSRTKNKKYKFKKK